MEIPLKTFFFIFCYVALPVNGGPQGGGPPGGRVPGGGPPSGGFPGGGPPGGFPGGRHPSGLTGGFLGGGRLGPEFPPNHTLLDYISIVVIPSDINMIDTIFPQNATYDKKIAKKAFTNVDTDGDKKLSKEEMRTKLQHLIGILFNSIDSNDNGFLEVSDREKLKTSAFNQIVEEIFSVLESIYLPPIPQFKEIVLKIDGDKDGKASKVEILTFIDGVMKKIDVNDDKMIDISEIAKAMEDMGLVEADKVKAMVEKEKEPGNMLFKSLLKIIDTNNDDKVDKEELNNVLETPVNNLMSKAPEVMQAYGQYQQATAEATQGLYGGPSGSIKPEKIEEWFLSTSGDVSEGNPSGSFKNTVNIPVLGACVLFVWQGLR